MKSNDELKELVRALDEILNKILLRYEVKKND